ncbi:MAG: hypothetical protein RBS80_31920 [Thermoguttaceae bacterium]|nr:hypothetical protein [Thermoguttaceae bacterium]
MSTADRIQAALREDQHLQSLCDTEPQVYELPFRKSANGTYIIVWLHFPNQGITHESIVCAVKTSVRVPSEQSLLDGYEGIEVVPVAGENLAGEGRIVRVGIERRALSEILTVPVAGFMGVVHPDYSGWYAQPCEGMYVSWYRDPNLIPTR